MMRNLTLKEQAIEKSLDSIKTKINIQLKLIEVDEGMKWLNFIT